jgi:hypothetical protein
MISTEAGRRRTALAVLVLVAVLSGCGGNSDRQADVAQRGSSVMPFDLDRTTHRFSKTDSGGVETVVADDATDSTQIALVRQHLRAEAERFGRGDFTDPGRVHGDDMPGLAALRASAGRLAVAYRDITSGGQITFSTGDPALVAALHAWFDAQVSDHGQHAEHG